MSVNCLVMFEDVALDVFLLFLLFFFLFSLFYFPKQTTKLKYLSLLGECAFREHSLKQKAWF